MLCFETEEEAGGEIVDVVHTDRVVGRPVLLGLKVPVAVGEGVPQPCEHQPGNDEGGRETEEGGGPGEVDHGYEEIFQVPEQDTVSQQFKKEFEMRGK